MTALCWFRLDLRRRDNPAWDAARQHGAVVPVYIWAPEEEGAWPPGAASRWWLHHSLAALARELGGLVIRRGPSLAALRQLVRETGATAVFWNRRYEPALIARDTQVKQALLADGLRVETFNSALLFEPWEIRTRTGGPYQVFTAFYRACREKMGAADGPWRPLAQARNDSYRLARLPASVPLEQLGLLPRPNWARDFDWEPGEAGARRRWEAFRAGAYAAERDWPARDGTSRMSPHLHFGEIAPHRLWEAAGAEPYRRQLIWREFAHHLLYHFPHTPERPLRPQWARFPWRQNAADLRAWQRGRTGYAVVDAGMRQLWLSGWMHNRVRMVVASFLVKDLLISWYEGARWFWDTLVDADLANNTLGWQWAAGCGADAAPYFRIFNPVTQARRFDPTGEYVRRWVSVPVAPMVDHAVARRRALAAWASLR
jgi:deoxyribodipyrimidine photo-lyase